MYCDAIPTLSDRSFTKKTIFKHDKICREIFERKCNNPQRNLDNFRSPWNIKPKLNCINFYCTTHINLLKETRAATAVANNDFK